MCQIIGVFERPFFVPLFVGQTWDICPLFVHFLSHICPTTKTTLFFAILGDPSTTEYLLDRPPTSARPGGSLAPIQPVARRCRASHPHARPTTVRAGVRPRGGRPRRSLTPTYCAALTTARPAGPLVRPGSLPPEERGGGPRRRARGRAGHLVVPLCRVQTFNHNQPHRPPGLPDPRSARGLSVR